MLGKILGGGVEMAAVLIVDDSRLSQRFMKKALLGVIPDAEITCASSGEEALDRAAQPGVEVTVALIDYNMPGIDGIECGEGLRQLHPAVLMVLVTANIQRALAERARAAGLLVLHKPFDEDKVRGVLSQFGKALCS